MDALYRGLAAPRQVIALGRPDVEASDRPGAALAGLARDALDAGAFPAGPAPLPPVRPVRADSRADADLDDGFDPENEVHLPEDGDPGLDEPDLDEALDH